MPKFRFYCTLARCLPRALFDFVPRCNYINSHKNKYTNEQRFAFATYIMRYITKMSFTNVQYYGKENIPENSNYIFYSNHQGKFDAVGILQEMKKPCSALWEKRQASKFLSRQISGLMDVVPIDLGNLRAQFEAISAAIKHVNAGGSILVFPEGGYANNQNQMQRFHSGCFRISIKTHVPAVPVCIWDSWKSMNSRSLKIVTTEIHYLKPIPYEEYKNMTKEELCALVQSRIQQKLSELEATHKK